MYELIQGTGRLIYVLFDYCYGDPEKVKVLSQLLNYLPEQLEIDMVCARDYFRKTRDNVENVVMSPEDIII